ncbi:MAG: type I-D CRISPR-associated protein Cas7/Csc2 [Chloroflexota bacterium]|nr:type I-D CRISPR-associated protein Cas7/Csc2 [Chloroflexota bacterium]
MSILSAYQPYFLEKYHNYPQGRYWTLIIARQIESEAIFRTEGSGEPLNREYVYAGKEGEEVIPRVVISKRKQTAVERRTGREVLRAFGLLKHSVTSKGETRICALNRNEPCEKCLDCMIYGFAAGGGGAQRARVITDDAFSLHPATTIVGARQFNALFDNSTMRDDDGTASTSIGTDEYVKPGSIFLDMETLRDLTREEFVYVVGNVLRSTRYGAISSRIGKVQNRIAGIIVSDCELFSNLELTQAVFDVLRQGDEPPFPLRLETVATTAYDQSVSLAASIPGRVGILSNDEVAQLVSEVTGIFQDEGTLRATLERASSMYPA